MKKIFQVSIELHGNKAKEKEVLVDSTNNIYSLHEPQVYCVSKGKEYKEHEFGSRASLVVTKNSGIIVGARSFEVNHHDGHTLPETLLHTTELVDRRPKVTICDRGSGDNVP